MINTTQQRQRFALNPGEELVPRPRKPRPLIGAGSASLAAYDATAQITELAEAATAAGDHRAAVCFYRALESLGRRRPAGIEAYPGPGIPVELTAPDSKPPKATSKPPTPQHATPPVEPESGPPPAPPSTTPLAAPPAAKEAPEAPEAPPAAAISSQESVEPPPPTGASPPVAAIPATAPPAGILAKEIAQAKTVKQKKALRELEAADMPDAVKKAKANALLNA